MTDYELGYQAYIDGIPFKDYESIDWQDGWDDAEDDNAYYGLFDNPEYNTRR